MVHAVRCPMIFREAVTTKTPKIIVLEGLDGSGKKTTADALAKALVSMGFSVGMESFPMYHKWHSFLVRLYLGGLFGKKSHTMNPRTISMFYAIDRFFAWHLDLKKRYANTDFIIFDRYTTSNMLFQGMKACLNSSNNCVLSTDDRNRIKDLTEYIKELEYGTMKLPMPFLTFVLNVTAERVVKNMENRKSLDINETLDIQLRACSIIRFMSQTYGWKRVDAMATETEMKQTHEIVTTMINTIMATIHHWHL